MPVGSDALDGDRRADLVAAERMAGGTLRGEDRLSAGGERAIDWERIGRRLEVKHPLLDAVEAPEVDGLAAGTVADAGIEEDLLQRCIQAVPVQAEIAARAPVPQRHDVGGADRPVV